MIAKSVARFVPAAMLAACLLSAPALAQQPPASAVAAARELVELTATIGAYNLVSRFLEAVQVDHETR